MLRVLEVSGAYFRAFEAFHWVLEPGLWQIVGENRSDLGCVSNGSGKSTLPDALYWCLSGKSLNADAQAADVLSLFHAQDCFVRVVLDRQGERLVVTRYRNHAQFQDRVILELNGQQISGHRQRETQQWIDQFIGLPAGFLGPLFFLQAGLSGRFSELTPSQRLDMLERMQDTLIWARVRGAASAEREAILERLRPLYAAREQKRGHLDALIKRLEQAPDATLESRLAAARDRLASLDQKWVRLTRVQAFRTRCRERLTRAIRRWQQTLRTHCDACGQVLPSADPARAAQATLYVQRAQALLPRYAPLDLRVLEQQRAAAKSQVDQLHGQWAHAHADTVATAAQQQGYQQALERVERAILPLERELDTLWWWDRQLGPQGAFRPRQLHASLDRINHSLARYAALLFTEWSPGLVLSPDGRTVHLRIDTPSGRKTLGMLSHGERKRLDLAVQFSLYDLVQTTFPVRLNVLFLDEVFDALDEVGIARAMDVLDLLSQWVETVYVLTHHSGLQSQVYQQLRVIKQDGVSRLECA